MKLNVITSYSIHYTKLYDETVAAYTYILKLYDEGCISPVIMGDGVDVWSGMATGVYASLDNGPWTYAIIGGQFPDFKISSAKFPAGPAGSIDVVGGEDVNLLTQSKHPEEAMEFIRYLMSENYQLTMIVITSYSIHYTKLYENQLGQQGIWLN